MNRADLHRVLTGLPAWLVGRAWMLFVLVVGFAVTYYSARALMVVFRSLGFAMNLSQGDDVGHGVLAFVVFIVPLFAVAAIVSRLNMAYWGSAGRATSATGGIVFIVARLGMEPLNDLLSRSASAMVLGMLIGLGPVALLLIYLWFKACESDVGVSS